MQNRWEIHHNCFASSHNIKKTNSMKNLIVIFIASFLYFSQNIANAQSKEASISNGIVSAKIYLPDAVNGYYRGTRFDWSGQVYSLKANGHSYFGQWFENYDPLAHDAIMGPVDDFYPVGYEAAKAGEKFLKIGIGTMIKPEDTNYDFTKRYEIVNTGKWNVIVKKDHVDFTHQFNDEKNAYLYKKTVQLVPGKTEMELLHTLTNKGKTTIDTRVYNHNYFVIDSQTTSPDFKVGFQFNPILEKPRPQQTGEIHGNEIVFNKVFDKNDHLVYAPVLGYGNEADDYNFTIENSKTGAAVRILADKPLVRLVFWAAEKTVCLEPYIAIKIEPGQSFSWKNSYQFYIVEEQK
jgi:hypothetical protein